MLSKKEASEAAEDPLFRDGMFVPAGPMKDILRAHTISSEVVREFRAGSSILALAEKYKMTCAEIEDEIRRQLQ
jgi:Mor family transcriptional regulator